MNPYRARLSAAVGCLILLASTVRAWPAEAPSKFLRFVADDDGGGKLQTAIVTYRNADGVRLHLVGAVHVGEKSYYRGLSDTFATYDALLYELVKPKDASAPAPNIRSASLITFFQRFLKDTLNLEFQLDAIDYRARNFVHADLDAETFARLQDERGESLLMLMLRQFLSEMSNPSKTPEVSLPELLVAITSPDSSRHFKLILARQFEDLEARTAGLEGPNGSVIVTERNKKAISVLSDQIAKGRKNLGIFYGAAHMKDMDERVRAMGFKPVSTEWRTAWDMTPKEGDVIVKTYKAKPVPATQP